MAEIAAEFTFQPRDDMATGGFSLRPIILIILLGIIENNEND